MRFSQEKQAEFERKKKAQEAERKRQAEERSACGISSWLVQFPAGLARGLADVRDSRTCAYWTEFDVFKENLVGNFLPIPRWDVSLEKIHRFVVTRFFKENWAFEIHGCPVPPILIHGFHSSPQNLPLTFFLQEA